MISADLKLGQNLKIAQKSSDRWLFRPAERTSGFLTKVSKKNKMLIQSQFSVCGRFHQGKSLRKFLDLVQYDVPITTNSEQI